MRSGTLLAHSLEKPGVWEDTSWEDEIVAKVDSKIFVFLGQEAIGVIATRPTSGCCATPTMRG